MRKIFIAVAVLSSILIALVACKSRSENRSQSKPPVSKASQEKPDVHTSADNLKFIIGYMAEHKLAFVLVRVNTGTDNLPNYGQTCQIGYSGWKPDADLLEKNQASIVATFEETGWSGTDGMLRSDDRTHRLDGVLDEVKREGMAGSDFPDPGQEPMEPGAEPRLPDFQPSYERALSTIRWTLEHPEQWQKKEQGVIHDRRKLRDESKRQDLYTLDVWTRPARPRRRNNEFVHMLYEPSKVRIHRALWKSHALPQALFRYR